MFSRSRASRPVSPRYHLTSNVDPSNANTSNAATGIMTPSPNNGTQGTQNTTAAAQQTAAPPTNVQANWYPFTLRWYFLLLPIFLSLVFGISVICLQRYSRSHYGLGPDDGTSMVLFAWRFLPTLVAVLYTQITVIIFEDVKRTEPFARLASSPPTGTSAYGTLLQSPKSWWGILYDMTFKRKQMGKTGWSLICALLVHVLALLAISPLSSALLATEEVLVPQTVDFIRSVPSGNVQVPMNGTRETYMRIMANMTRNMSDSAWTSDDSFTLPFWPASGERQMQSKIQSDYHSWEAQTTTFSTGYSCENMTLESANLHNRTYYTLDWHRDWIFNGTTPMVTYMLSSASGCRYDLTVNPAADLSSYGSIQWSDATTYHIQPDGRITMDHLMVEPSFGKDSPWVSLNASKECKGRDIIIVNTRWSTPPSEDELTSMNPKASIWHQSPYFKMRALLCKSTYEAKVETLKMSLALAQPTRMDRTVGPTTQNPSLVSESIDLDEFQATGTDDKWRLYFGEPSKNRDPDLPQRFDTAGAVGGLGVVLGFQYNYSIDSMLEDPDLVAKASKIKGRIFAETLRDAFDTPDALKQETSQGTAITLQERVVVVSEISTTLCVLFLVSFFLQLALLWFSRIQRRPLQLWTDPGSAIGLSALLNPQITSSRALKEMHRDPRQVIRMKLRSETFQTFNGTLHQGTGTFGSAAPAGKKIKLRDWRPRAIHIKTLFALCSFLLLIGAAVFVLYTFASSSRLYQKVFTYETDLSLLGLSISSFAPISIAPAIISIVITLWWDQIDATFRLLQPYIAMAQEPTPMYRGAGLTYRSKTWLGAAIKAARNRHWILFMVAMGSTLCQVLTVSMSALFERRLDNVSRDLSVNRTLQVRQHPLVSSWDFKPSAVPSLIVDSMFTEYSSNWLYNAALQLSMNGDQIAWTKDDWSFVPLDLLQTIDSSERSSTLGSNSSAAVASNATLSTSAIRIRIDCENIPAIQNTSSWLTRGDDGGVTNVTLIQETTGIQNFTSFRRTIFEGTPAATTILNVNATLQCCQNGTSKSPNTAAIGYWSPISSSGDAEQGEGGSQYSYRPRPVNFVAKWIIGEPILATYKPVNVEFKETIFEEVPRMQAALCKPIIETAEASVLLDQVTGSVHSYNLSGSPVPLDSAWSDRFLGHNVTHPELWNDRYYSAPHNYTTSLGVLFINTLLSAAGSGSFEGKYENLEFNAFNFRDHTNGLNLDLMSYSMYVMTGKDPQALLNYTTLVTATNRTLQLFFQQFVQAGFNLTSGDYAFQAVNDTTMPSIGPVTDLEGNEINRPAYPTLNADPKGEATVTNRIQILYLNPIATFLSIGILIWLIGTAVVIICVQRRYTRSMMRNVELIADVMVLVAGSENFLKMIQERGVALKRDQNVCTRLGWFKGRDGQVRWGLEVVGGRNAVEWVDAPKRGTL